MPSCCVYVSGRGGRFNAAHNVPSGLARSFLHAGFLEVTLETVSGSTRIGVILQYCD